jgi:hypothetical protein
MASTKSLVVNILHGYPDPVSNKHRLIANYKGPTEYDAGGCPMEIPRGMKWVEFLECSMAKNYTSNALYLVRPIFTTDVKGSNAITLIFIDVSTGLEVAGNPDLSVSTFRANFLGRI